MYKVYVPSVRSICGSYRFFCIIQTATAELEDLPFPLTGRNDELIVLRCYHQNPLVGAIMGVEVKKKLTWASKRQAETEFWLFAANSLYPFCQVRCSGPLLHASSPFSTWHQNEAHYVGALLQVATDFQNGGIAYYMSGHPDKARVITGRCVCKDLKHLRM